MKLLFPTTGDTPHYHSVSICLFPVDTQRHRSRQSRMASCQIGNPETRRCPALLTAVFSDLAVVLFKLLLLNTCTNTSESGPSTKLHHVIHPSPTFTNTFDVWFSVKNHNESLELSKCLQADGQAASVARLPIKAMFPSYMLKHLTGVFAKFLPFKKKRKNPPIPPQSPSLQVRKTSEYSPLPATFAHCPHSCPETQYLTIDKQLTHLFFRGTR